MYTYLCKEMINTKFGGGRKQTKEYRRCFSNTGNWVWFVIKILRAAFQAWPQAIMEALPGRHHRRKLPSPHQIWCKASALQSLKELQSRSQAPGLWCSFIYLRSSAPAFLGPLSEGLGRGLLDLCWDLFRGVLGRNLKDTFPHSELVLSTFPLLVFPSSPRQK